MRNKQTIGTNAMRLFAIGLVVVALGAIIYLWQARFGCWTMIAGGAAITISMLSRAIQMRSADARARRLDRMALLGGLCYVIAGGLGLDGGSSWKVVFAIATVFVCYSIFVRKEEDKKE